MQSTKIPNDLKVYELGFTVMTKLLALKDYESKDEILAVASNALNLIKDDDTVSSNIKEAYQNAISRFKGMTWEEIKNVKNHL
ncbi:MAG: hypothetical protein IJW82_01625 [Clostridia bacterium]|nr:hypothetical protein [Clostridia bacterium]